MRSSSAHMVWYQWGRKAATATGKPQSIHHRETEAGIEFQMASPTYSLPLSVSYPPPPPQPQEFQGIPLLSEIQHTNHQPRRQWWCFLVWVPHGAFCLLQPAPDARQKEGQSPVSSLSSLLSLLPLSGCGCGGGKNVPVTFHHGRPALSLSSVKNDILQGITRNNCHESQRVCLPFSLLFWRLSLRSVWRHSLGVKPISIPAWVMGWSV